MKLFCIICFLSLVDLFTATIRHLEGLAQGSLRTLQIGDHWTSELPRF